MIIFQCKKGRPVLNSTLRTKALIEGALMACITAILALTGTYLPFLGFIITLFFAIPTIIIAIRHGLSAAVLSLLTAGVLVAILYEPVRGAALLLDFGPLALFYGYALSRNKSPVLTLTVGAVVSAASQLLAIYFIYLLTGVNELSLFEQMRESIEPMIETLREMGTFNNPQITEEMARQMLNAYVDGVLLLIPGAFALFGIFAAVTNYVISQKVLSKLGKFIQPLPPFTQWKMPWWGIYGLILGLVFNVAGNWKDNELLGRIGINIINVYWILFFVLGMSLVFYLQNRYFPGKMFRWFLIFIIVLFYSSIAYIVIIVALIDTFYDFRQKIARKI